MPSASAIAVWVRERVARIRRTLGPANILCSAICNTFYKILIFSEQFYFYNIYIFTSLFCQRQDIITLIDR